MSKPEGADAAETKEPAPPVENEIKFGRPWVAWVAALLFVGFAGWMMALYSSVFTVRAERGSGGAEMTFTCVRESLHDRGGGRVVARGTGVNVRLHTGRRFFAIEVVSPNMVQTLCTGGSMLLDFGARSAAVAQLDRVARTPGAEPVSATFGSRFGGAPYALGLLVIVWLMVRGTQHGHVRRDGDRLVLWRRPMLGAAWTRTVPMADVTDVRVAESGEGRKVRFGVELVLRGDEIVSLTDPEHDRHTWTKPEAEAAAAAIRRMVEDAVRPSPKARARRARA